MKHQLPKIDIAYTSKRSFFSGDKGVTMQADVVCSPEDIPRAASFIWDNLIPEEVFGGELLKNLKGGDVLGANDPSSFGMSETVSSQVSVILEIKGRKELKSEEVCENVVRDVVKKAGGMVGRELDDEVEEAVLPQYQPWSVKVSARFEKFGGNGSIWYRPDCCYSGVHQVDEGGDSGVDGIRIGPDIDHKRRVFRTFLADPLALIDRLVFNLELFDSKVISSLFGAAPVVKEKISISLDEQPDEQTGINPEFKHLTIITNSQKFRAKSDLPVLVGLNQSTSDSKILVPLISDQYQRLMGVLLSLLIKGGCNG
jgi:hypothetical protein